MYVLNNIILMHEYVCNSFIRIIIIGKLSYCRNNTYNQPIKMKLVIIYQVLPPYWLIDINVRMYVYGPVLCLVTKHHSVSAYMIETFSLLYHKFVRSPAPYHGILRTKLKSYSTCYDAYDKYQFSSEKCLFLQLHCRFIHSFKEIKLWHNDLFFYNSGYRIFIHISI